MFILLFCFSQLCRLWLDSGCKLPSLPKLAYAKRTLENPTYDLMVHLLRPFDLISMDESIEINCLVPEMNEHLNLILYLLDAENC